MTSSNFSSPGLFVSLFVVGLGFEAVIWMVSDFLVSRFSAEYPLLGPILFGISLCFVYAAANVISRRYATGLVPAMSLITVSGMIAWLGLAALFLLVVLFLLLPVAAVVVVPGRAVLETVGRHGVRGTGP